MKRLTIMMVALACWLGATPTARAYRCLRVGCPAWCGPVPYRLAGASDDLEALGAGTSETQLRLAMDDWTRVPCSSLETMPEASTGAPIESGDGLTTFGWVETDWPFDSNAIGITEHRSESIECLQWIVRDHPRHGPTRERGLESRESRRDCRGTHEEMSAREVVHVKLYPVH